ncbi:hypothetical protein OEZ85_003656 [Tetradesmus obliquus]|uniref:phytol kinase n=1 Tax=Tetradesmus obliquus TaxID=3088 RepID=A0ABY8UC97_TETOB|nr:hypothetical protein OEZ85_003656 [Tetradesmus obliquus]
MDLSSNGGGGSSRASMQQQLAAAAEAAAAAAHDPPLLTATVHLRRAAVLLELCLLQPNSCTYFIVIGCIQQSMTCMFRCLRAESSSDAAAWDRVYAAIGNGILPAVLQQLLPVLPLLMQQAEQASGATGGGSVAQGLAMLLSTVLAGTHIPDAQLIDALQQPSSAAALESCVRCWAHELLAQFLFGEAFGRESLKELLSLRSAVPAELAQQLVGFAAALSGRFPVKLCCNAPGCTSLDEFSELEAVGGKACMCSGCKTARYCCRACQESHWKVHKAACRALAAARQ